MNRPAERLLARAAAQSPQLSRSELAYEHLRTELLEGPLRPSEKVSVVSISKQLGFSRVPVMEALKKLQSEGFVEIIPQVGCQVAKPIISEVADFFNLFAVVESSVVGLAAERRTDEDIDDFKTLCRSIDKRLRTSGGPHDNDPIYRQLNLEFHSAIHRMARSPVSTRYATSLWDRSDFYIKIAFGSLYFSNFVKRAHRSMRQGIIEGKPEIAKNAAFSQLKSVGERVVVALKNQI